MLRSICNSLLSILMVATMLYGGCVACSQFFMFPTAKEDCCKAGRCQKSQQNTSTKECKRMPLELHGLAHFDPPTAEVTAVTPELEPPTATLAEPLRVGLFAHSPPELYVLHATFLI